MNIVLLRHPRPQVAPGLCYGRTDLPLHPDGLAAIPAIVAQARTTGPRVVWTSPARRCLVLAEALAEAAGIEMRVDARLQELDFGTWEGRDWNTMDRAALDEWAADPHGFAPPGGESGAALLERVRDVHGMLLAAKQDCAVISHGGPLKLLHGMLQGLPPDLLAAPPAIGSVVICRAVQAARSAGEAVNHD